VPLEQAPPSLQRWVADLNVGTQHFAAKTLLGIALSDPMFGRVALVSSFGAESAVLLHMVSVINRDLPVLFVDTGLLFEETLAYQLALSETLGLRDVRVIRGDTSIVDPDDSLHQRDVDACCHLRKVAPLQNALRGFDTWITGRKRFQGGRRAELETYEIDGARLKVNPLARWRSENVLEYRENNGLRPHPLVARGYPSIGCRPCTSKVAPGEDARSGRWAGAEKTECGIHFESGRMVKTGVET